MMGFTEGGCECGMCKLREQTEETKQELDFRFVQIQVELQHGLPACDVDKCEARILELTAKIITNLRRRASMEDMHGEFDDLDDQLKKSLN